jgi:hypothetical protein
MPRAAPERRSAAFSSGADAGRNRRTVGSGALYKERERGGWKSSLQDRKTMESLSYPVPYGRLGAETAKAAGDAGACP